MEKTQHLDRDWNGRNGFSSRAHFNPQQAHLTVHLQHFVSIVSFKNRFPEHQKEQIGQQGSLPLPPPPPHQNAIRPFQFNSKQHHSSSSGTGTGNWNGQFNCRRLSLCSCHFTATPVLIDGLPAIQLQRTHYQHSTTQHTKNTHLMANKKHQQWEGSSSNGIVFFGLLCLTNRRKFQSMSQQWWWWWKMSNQPTPDIHLTLAAVVANHKQTFLSISFYWTHWAAAATRENSVTVQNILSGRGNMAPMFFSSPFLTHYFNPLLKVVLAASPCLLPPVLSPSIICEEFPEKERGTIQAGRQTGTVALDNKLTWTGDRSPQSRQSRDPNMPPSHSHPLREHNS